MIKKLFVFLALLILPFQGLNFSHVMAANPNLIANSSVESLDSTNQAPLDWLKGGWGTNSAYFQLGRPGQSGSTAVMVNMTKYTSGDAKWYFNPVSVDSANQYNFSDYYSSRVATDVVAMYLDANGKDSYGYLGQTPATASWQRASFTITPPSGTKAMTVFHVLNKVGTLWTDNYSLSVAEKSIITDNVPNGGMESMSFTDSKLPMDWQHGKWGMNTTGFSYENTGHTGSKSVKVQMTKYSSGDAKWYYTPQAIEGGKTYQFSDWYKSSVKTKVMAVITNTDGTVNYINLKDAPASSSTWSQYKGIFTTPASAATLTIFHMISAVGSLTTDDYAITPAAAPIFNQPLISVTFDDGWKSQYTNALPVLSKHQIFPTYYLVSSYLNQPEYLTKSEAHSLQLSGGEIGSHSVTHPLLTSLPLEQMLNELVQSKTDLQKDYGQINSFSVPYDDYNDTLINSAKNYYTSVRISDSGYNNIGTFDKYRLKTQNITNSTTINELNGWIMQAKRDNSWLILLYHQVDENGGDYSITPANFDLQMSAIKSSGIKTNTVKQALTELLPQVK